LEVDFSFFCVSARLPITSPGTSARTSSMTSYNAAFQFFFFNINNRSSPYDTSRDCLSSWYTENKECELSIFNFPFLFRSTVYSRLSQYLCDFVIMTSCQAHMTHLVTYFCSQNTVNIQFIWFNVTEYWRFFLLVLELVHGRHQWRHITPHSNFFFFNINKHWKIDKITVNLNTRKYIITML
jgi:hypothetical protein